MKDGTKLDREEWLGRLEARLGYRFSCREYLREALRHSSLAHELGVGSNERLEFLGDAALSHAAAAMVFAAWPGAGEGALTRGRALLVREATLSRLARDLDLESGMQRAPGVEPGPALLADTLEAVLGAVFLDGGWEVFRATAERLLNPVLATIEVSSLPKHEPKSTLQEHAQRCRLPLPVYREVGRWGPEHRQLFVFDVELDGRVLGRGEGSSKREAQQAAARQALEQLSADSDGEEPGW